MPLGPTNLHGVGSPLIPPLKFRGPQTPAANATTLRVTQIGVEAWVSSGPTSNSQSLQVTQVGVEVFISSPAAQSMQLTQVGIEAWVASNPPVVQQWNPHFPDKPGKGGGGSGPPGHNPGDGPPPTVKIGGAYGDLDVEFDTLDYKYPSWLLTSTGPTWFLPPGIPIQCSMFAAAFLRIGAKMTVHEAGRVTAASFGKAGPTFAARTGERITSSARARAFPNKLRTSIGAKTTGQAKTVGRISTTFRLASGKFAAAFGRAGMRQTLGLGARVTAGARGSARPKLSVKLSALVKAMSSVRLGLTVGFHLRAAIFAAAVAKAGMTTASRLGMRVSGSARVLIGPKFSLALSALIKGMSSASSRLTIFPLLEAVGEYITRFVGATSYLAKVVASYVTKMVAPATYRAKFKEFLTYISRAIKEKP